MRIYRELSRTRLDQDTALSVGAFDAVHRGHQHLFARLREIAQGRGLWAGAVVLDPHPREVLKPEKPFLYLTTAEERVRLLGDLGLDFVVLQPFTGEFCLTTAREFVRLLKDNLRMRVLVAGPDFALGHKREGDLYTLRVLGQELGFDLEVVEPLYLQGLPVRSTTIRALVGEGKVAEAPSFLGRPPTVSGVASRESEGLTLKVWEKQLLPAPGLYAARLHWDEGFEWTLASIEKEGRRVTTHSLGDRKEIRGQRVYLEFIRRLPSNLTPEDAARLLAEMEKEP